MRTITIPDDEYLQIQQSIRDLKKEAKLNQDEDFIKKLSLIYKLFCEKEDFNEERREKISLKRGSGREIITYISEDFDEPLDDFCMIKNL